MSDVRLFIVQKNAGVEGPFSVDQLRQRWDAGQLSSEARYWHRGALGWRPVTEFRVPTPSECVVSPILATRDQVEGRRIVRQTDVIHASGACASSWSAELRDLVGQREVTTAELASRAQQRAMDGLREEAKTRNLDAVVSVSVRLSQLAGKGTLMMVAAAVGTGVMLSDSWPEIPWT